MAGGSARRRLGIPKGHPVSWLMLVVTTGAILITSIDRVILPRVLPAIIDEFGLTNTQAGFLNSLNFIGLAFGSVILGAFGDALGKGPRRAWTWGVAVLVATVAAIATAFSRSLGALQFWRVFMGAGTGGMEPVNVAMISDWWQKEDRGFAVGVHHTGFPIGQFVGPLLIGLTLAVATWREAFLFIPLIAIPIVVLQIVLARRRNLERVNDWTLERDMTPSVTVDEVDRNRRENPVGTVRIALANRNVRLAIMMAFCFLFAEFGVDTFLTVYLNSEVGIPAATAAIVSGASGITGWIGQIGWSTLSDTTGRKSSLYFLAVGWATAVIALIFIGGLTSAWIILLFWGLFRNAPFPVVYSLLIDSVPDAASSGMGLMIGIALGVAATISATAAGFVIDNFGYTVNYIFLALPCLLALIPIFLMRETVGAGGADETQPRVV